MTHEQDHGVADINSDVALRMNPGTPGMDQFELRVSPAYADELQHLLEETPDLYQGRKIELSATVTLAVLLVAAVGPKLVPALQTWIDRHQYVKVEFNHDGSLKAVSGTSLEKAQALYDDAEQKREMNERRWAEIKAETVHLGRESPTEDAEGSPEG